MPFPNDSIMRSPAPILPRSVAVGLLYIVGFGPTALAAEDVKPDDEVRKAVVQITCSRRAPDVFRPWQKENAEKTGGSGVVIDGERILTNAHVVLYAAEIFVQATDTGHKIPATVAAVAPGIDLAVLTLKDKEFFKKRPAVVRAEKPPRVRDTVSVYGFPIGGAGLSITKGVVSRIEFTEYNSPVTGLRIQVDAAINPGNSGGPAIVDDKLVGLAFAQLVEGENIGYIIPTEEIELFLADIKDGKYDGKFAMFDEVQAIENDALRERVGLPAGAGGLYVNQPAKCEPSNPLRTGDVITKINGFAIDDEGMCRIGDSRLSYLYAAQIAGRGGSVPVTVQREGKRVEFKLPLVREPDFLLKPLDGKYPSYFVCGPLVFTGATLDYAAHFLDASDKDLREATHALIDRQSPLITRCNSEVVFPGEQLVVLTTVFPHALSRGYDEAAHQVLTHVNGQAVKNLKHLVEIVRGSKDKHLEFRFADRPATTVVLDRQQALDAMDDILSDNGVRNPCSPDLRDVKK